MPNDSTQAADADVLASICSDTRADVASRKAERPIESLKQAIASRSDVPRGFGQALKEATISGRHARVSFIIRMSTASSPVAA